MIVFVQDNCKDCKRLVDYFIDTRTPVELVDGEKTLQDHISGRKIRFSKLEVVDMLAAMAMQDDEFPVMLVNGDFMGKAGITAMYGVHFDEN